MKISALIIRQPTTPSNGSTRLCGVEIFDSLVKLRRRHLAVVVCLLAILASAPGCGGNSEPSRSPQPTVETPPAISPTTEEEEFVPEPRTFHIITEQSEARYEVDEELTFLGIPLNRAIGRTSEVTGEFGFYRDITDNDKLVVSSGHFEVDLSALTSNDSRRDERIRDRWLQSTLFPLAVFDAKEVRGFPEDVPTDEGQIATWSFELKGDMTVRDVTRNETFQIDVVLSGDSMEGTATVHLKMKDYKFDPPEIAGLFKVEDGVDVIVEFRAKEALGGP